MPQEVYQHTFANGLTLLAERMDHVRSAALNFLVPAGCVYDRPRTCGIASVLADMITRGAGERDSRELTLALDNLGLDRSESVGLMHTRFWGATVASNMAAALELYADILRRPHLPEDEIDPVKALALQDLHGLEDEPRRRCLIELRKQHYPAAAQQRSPRHRRRARSHHRRRCAPSTIGSCSAPTAPSCRWPATSTGSRCATRSAGCSATGPTAHEPKLTLRPAADASARISPRTLSRRRSHGLRQRADRPSRLLRRPGAVNVLSGGMSCRLFTNSREGRALLRRLGHLPDLQGPGQRHLLRRRTNERAQRTLDLLFRELRRLAEGIEAEEVNAFRPG